MSNIRDKRSVSMQDVSSVVSEESTASPPRPNCDWQSFRSPKAQRDLGFDELISRKMIGNWQCRWSQKPAGEEGRAFGGAGALQFAFECELRSCVRSGTPRLELIAAKGQWIRGGGAELWPSLWPLLLLSSSMSLSLSVVVVVIVFLDIPIVLFVHVLLTVENQESREALEHETARHNE